MSWAKNTERLVEEPRCHWGGSDRGCSRHRHGYDLWAEWNSVMGVREMVRRKREMGGRALWWQQWDKSSWKSRFTKTTTLMALIFPALPTCQMLNWLLNTNNLISAFPQPLMSDRTKLTYLFPWEYSQPPLTPPAPDEENSVCALWVFFLQSSPKKDGFLWEGRWGWSRGGKKPCVAEAGGSISWLCSVRCSRATREMTRGLGSGRGVGIWKNIIVNYLRVSSANGIPCKLFLTAK